MSPPHKILREYSYSAATDIVDICSPLFHLGLKGFFYLRIYNNNTFIDLQTHSIWAEHFYKKFFSLEYSAEEIKNEIYLSDGVSLWISNEANKVWQEGKEVFGFGNGLLMVSSTPQYKEIHCYYSDIKNYKINQFYLNNLDLFKNFLSCFKEKAAKHIKKAEISPILLPERYVERGLESELMICQENDIKQFYASLDIKKFYIDGMRYLTYKEAECLYWYTLGKTSLEIGIMLNMSNRTAEAHLARVKEKLNCYSKASITKKAISLGIAHFFMSK